MKVKQLAVAIALIGAGAALNVHAEEKVNKVERVEVTGSSIKRIKKEGATAVETVNRKAIEKTGATTVQELVKNITAVDFFDYGEQKANSPTGSGASNIKMRGLNESDVLVLMNGRRIPTAAFTDVSGSGAAVDINMIPLSAIERVEVLKDGGSAIYGSDAVAGVVNFITKKNYQGGEIRGGLGQSSRGDGTEKTFGMTGGYGDLDEQGFNVLATFDVLKREAIYAKDRDMTKSNDFRRFGGSDDRSDYSPYGNLLNDDGDIIGTVKPGCPAELQVDKGCKYDPLASLLTISNAADRMGGMLQGSVKLTDNITAMIQGFYSKSTDHFEAHPVPDVFLTADGKEYLGRFMQAGPRTTDRESTLSQLTAGLDGNAAGFDWSVSAGYGVSKSSNQDSNYLHALKYKANKAKIDATSTNNDQALVDSIKVSPLREAENKQSFLNAKVSGETGIVLDGGAVAFAVGMSLLKESLVDTPDLLTQEGLVKGSIKQAATDVSRTGKGLFAELAIPVTKTLEFQAAARYDQYESESHVSPRLAVRFQPIPELMLRSSFSESFRMPSLKQISENPSEGSYKFSGEDCKYINKPDTCNVSGYSQTKGNANLKPEIGHSFNFGAVVDVGVFSGSVDWWLMKKDDVITTPTEAEALVAGQWFIRDKQPIVFKQLLNRGQFESSGVDTDFRVRLPLDIATVTFSNSNSYYLYSKSTNATGEMEDGLDVMINGTPTPVWRNTFRVDVEKAGWSGGAAVRSTAGFKDSKVSIDDVANYDPDTKRVDGFTEVDLNLSYTGFKGLKLDFTVKNALDAEPPFSNVGTTFQYPGYAPIYSARGRFYTLGAKYSF